MGWKTFFVVTGVLHSWIEVKRAGSPSRCHPVFSMFVFPMVNVGHVGWDVQTELRRFFYLCVQTNNCSWLDFEKISSLWANYYYYYGNLTNFLLLSVLTDELHIFCYFIPPFKRNADHIPQTDVTHTQMYVTTASFLSFGSSILSCCRPQSSNSVPDRLYSQSQSLGRWCYCDPLQETNS